MTEPIKFISGDEVGFGFTISPGLEEDQVWCATVSPLLEGLPANNIDIWQYCVTEMVNNAIDHSEGSKLTVVVGSIQPGRRDPGDSGTIEGKADDGS
jgi:hypothetical protein